MDETERRTAAPDPPFVGRTAELETLRRSIGDGRLVLVCGDAGIGKTRIAEELVHEAERRGAAAYWGRCWEGEGAPAFWPWTQILRAHLRAAGADGVRAHDTDTLTRLAALAPEIRDAATAPAALSSDPARARFQLFDAMTAFLRTVAARHPVVLIVEDLHWADMPSRALLQYLARELGAAPVLLVVTYRDAEASRSPSLSDLIAALSRHRHCTQLALQGLGEDDVRALVAAHLETAPPELIRALMHKTAGNPFFLTQLLQLLARGAPTIRADPSALGIPDGVRDAVNQRLRGHGQPSRAVLDAAAVIGDEFALPALHALDLCPPDALLHALGDAIARRVLGELPDKPGRYRFTHALIRETLYDELALAGRVDLHERVGQALERCYGASAEQHAAELAHHFLAAAVRDAGARAIAYAIHAGDEANRILAYEEAVAWYRLTLDTIDAWRPADQHRVIAVSVALGEAQIRAGQPKEAEETFLRVAALARTLALPEMLARAVLGLGQIDRVQSHLGGLLDEALTALDPKDGSLRARLLSLRTVLLYWAPSEGQKRALSDEAIAMARRLDDVPTLTYVLSSRIASLSGPDDVEVRLAAATEMAELGERCGDRELGMVGHGWCIADRLALGQIERVRQDIEAFAARARAVRHPYLTWWSAVLTTMCAVLEGRLAEAERLAHEALALGQHAVTSEASHVFAGQLYALRIEQERLRELEPIMRSIVDQFPSIPGARAGLGLLYAETERATEAAAELEHLAENDFAALPRNPEWLSAIAVLAQTTALLPEAPHAARLYELLRPYEHLVIVSALGSICSGAVAHFLGILATRLERWEAAEAHLAQALQLHTRIGGPIWAAYTRYESAVLGGAAGADPAHIESLVTEVTRVADEIGMPRLQRKLGQLDARRAPLYTSPASPNGSERVGILRHDGDYWTLAYSGPAFHLKDSIGLHYIAMLIQDPVREFLAADLVATLRSGRGTPPVGEEPVPGDYRLRLASLRREIADAERARDGARAARLHTEVESLAAELTRAGGLGGRGRKAAPAVERARVSATRAIQAAVRRIGKNDPALARHLAGAIHTGTFCSYTPDPGTHVSWRL